MEEIWKDIDGYEGLYQVSNLGRVKSLRFGKERILKSAVDGRGYLVITLCLKGKMKMRTIHQLVAEAFFNHKPNGMIIVVDHINDIKIDNRLENLQLISQRENTYKTQDKYSSKFKGVSWNKFSKKWGTSINIYGKKKHLGYFTNEIEASEIYQLALKNIDKYNGCNKEFRKLINDGKEESR